MRCTMEQIKANIRSLEEKNSPQTDNNNVASLYPIQGTVPPNALSVRNMVARKANWAGIETNNKFIINSLNSSTFNGHSTVCADGSNHFGICQFSGIPFVLEKITINNDDACMATVEIK